MCINRQKQRDKGKIKNFLFFSNSNCIFSMKSKRMDMTWENTMTRWAIQQKNVLLMRTWWMNVSLKMASLRLLESDWTGLIKIMIFWLYNQE